MGGRSNDRLARLTGSDGAGSIRRDSQQPPLQRRRERCWRICHLPVPTMATSKKTTPCPELTPTWRVALMELTARHWPVRTRLGPKRTAPTRSFCFAYAPAGRQQRFRKGRRGHGLTLARYLPCCGAAGRDLHERQCWGLSRGHNRFARAFHPCARGRIADCA